MSEIIKTGPFEGWTDIMPITETAEKKLRPCAFCGRMPKTIYAVFSFTRREVCTQVVCMHKGCPVEYTEAPALRMFSVMEWNARPIEDARAARIAELEAELDRLREALKEIVMLSTVDQVCNNCRHCQKLRNMDWCAWYCNAVDDSSTQGCRKFEMADFHNSDVHTIARKALKGAENDQV